MRIKPTRLRRLAACALAAGGLGVIADAVAQQPAPAPAAAPADDLNRPVAYIYGNVAVTRAEFGEFLMARGGTDKLDLFINRKIIEHECARRNVAVTQKEMEAALLDDLAGLSFSKSDFIKQVLPRYGKSLYEWMEDVIRPRLLLAKLCHDRVTVADADLQKQFEREFGEKRRMQIIMWPKGDDLKAIQETYGKIRASQDEFDRAARAQANPSLAAACGNITVARYTQGEEAIVIETAYKLKPGEVSEVLSTRLGYVVLKLKEIVPPDPKVNFEKEKPRLHKKAYDEKMSQEIPKLFAELKAAAKPNFIFTGPELWKAIAGPNASAENVLKGVEVREIPAGKK
ncbi:MAG TPA: peptidylprolyl isomerase [Fimbriiglobus sp.]|nr:peptidylprolyl isomerase [Fimbriiglobus sp.]